MIISLLMLKAGPLAQALVFLLIPQETGVRPDVQRLWTIARRIQKRHLEKLGETFWYIGS